MHQVSLFCKGIQGHNLSSVIFEGQTHWMLCTVYKLSEGESHCRRYVSYEIIFKQIAQGSVFPG